VPAAVPAWRSAVVAGPGVLRWEAVLCLEAVLC
jgi:hypothetical protein